MICDLPFRLIYFLVLYSFLLVARGGIEPPFQEWKSCVLTDRRTGHPIVAFLLFALSNQCLFLDCGCKGRNFFETDKQFLKKISVFPSFFSCGRLMLLDFQLNMKLRFVEKKISFHSAMDNSLCLHLIIYNRLYVLSSWLLHRFRKNDKNAGRVSVQWYPSYCSLYKLQYRKWQLFHCDG